MSTQLDGWPRRKEGPVPGFSEVSLWAGKVSALPGCFIHPTTVAAAGSAPSHPLPREVHADLATKTACLTGSN